MGGIIMWFRKKGKKAESKSCPLCYGQHTEEEHHTRVALFYAEHPEAAAVRSMTNEELCYWAYGQTDDPKILQ
jgi:hypothetical protein